jgi:hypothetical protein
VTVKAADVLHNTRSLIEQLAEQGPATWDSYSRGPKESLWYNGSVAAIVRERLGSHPLAGELEHAIRDLERILAEAEAV